MTEILRIAQIMGKWHGGGVESVVMNYYRNIDRTKIQFDFICDSDSSCIPYSEIESLGGRVIEVPPYQKVLPYRKALVKILKENGYKIVHSHINTLSVFPLSAAKKAGVPVRISHSHSSTSKKEFKRNLVKKFLRLFSKVYATDYICCSEIAGRFQFGNRAYDKGQVFLLNNAIDLEKFRCSSKIRKAKRQELGIAENTLVLGHIGRFVTVKNQMFIIDILCEVKKLQDNAVLVFAGKGPLEQELKEYAFLKGVTESIQFLGQRNDCDQLYQAFDAFLLPSLYEGLPVVLVEGQACGLRCFASTNVPRQAKISDDLEFLPIQDAADWAKEIVKTAGKPHSDNFDVCTKNGYNIKENAKILEQKYLKAVL